MAQVGCGYCGVVRSYDDDDDDVVGFAGACPKCGQRLEPVSPAAARQLLREWDIARRYRRAGPAGATGPEEGGRGTPPLGA